MKVLKHINIAYLLEEKSQEPLPFFEKLSSNLVLKNSFDDLIVFLKKKSCEILFIEKDIDNSKLELLRELNSNMHIIVLRDKVSTKDYHLALNLSNILFIDFEQIKYSLKPVLKNIVKKIDSSKTNIENLKNGFIFDSYNTILLKDNEIISLSKKESMFLDYIIDNKDRAVPYEEINKTLWNGNMTQNALRSVVKEVRRKVYKDLIKNISGTGYKANL